MSSGYWRNQTEEDDPADAQPDEVFVVESEEYLGLVLPKDTEKCFWMFRQRYQYDPSSSAVEGIPGSRKNKNPQYWTVLDLLKHTLLSYRGIADATNTEYKYVFNVARKANLVDRRRKKKIRGR